MTATEDAAAFTDQNLAQYEVVIWLSTTGDVLNDEQQAAFERYIQGGGGYAGIHAASDTEYDWAWYGGLVAAYFLDHPGGANRFRMPRSRSPARVRRRMPSCRTGGSREEVVQLPLQPTRCRPRARDGGREDLHPERIHRLVRHGRGSPDLVVP